MLRGTWTFLSCSAASSTSRSRLCRWSLAWRAGSPQAARAPRCGERLRAFAALRVSLETVVPFAFWGTARHLVRRSKIEDARKKRRSGSFGKCFYSGSRSGRSLRLLKALRSAGKEWFRPEHVPVLLHFVMPFPPSQRLYGRCNE